MSDRASALRVLALLRRTSIGDEAVLVGSSGFFGLETAVPALTEDIDLAIPEGIAATHGDEVASALTAAGFKHEPGTATFSRDDGTTFDLLGVGKVSDQRFCRFRPKIILDATYVRLAIEEPLAFVERTEVATTVINLGKSDIDQFAVLVPSRAALDAFARTVAPFIARQLTQASETRSLARLRDELLPRLLSGELSVAHAELSTSEVA